MVMKAKPPAQWWRLYPSPIVRRFYRIRASSEQDALARCTPFILNDPELKASELHLMFIAAEAEGFAEDHRPLRGRQVIAAFV
jgi:hypothetical protein